MQIIKRLRHKFKNSVIHNVIGILAVILTVWNITRLLFYILSYVFWYIWKAIHGFKKIETIKKFLMDQIWNCNDSYSRNPLMDPYANGILM